MVGLTTLLASAVRDESTDGPDQSNHRASGAYLFLDVTANPGGAETLQVALQIKDTISGKYHTLVSFPVTAAAANATYVYCLRVGAAETVATGATEVQSLPLPGRWRARVIHSSTGEWTYSLSAQTVP